MGEIDRRLAELGITLPQAAKPVANYVPWVRTGNLVFISGQGPIADGAVAIPRDLQVTFNGIAMRHRGGESRTCVLDDAPGRVMQPTMGNGPRGEKIEGARHSTSIMASTSVEMPMGSDGDATAERAWRPLSPNTSTIRSEAPLITLG